MSALVDQNWSKAKVKMSDYLNTCDSRQVSVAEAQTNSVLKCNDLNVSVLLSVSGRRS